MGRLDIIDTPIGEVDAAELGSDIGGFWKVHFGDGRGNRTVHGRPVEVVSAYGGADRGSKRTGTVAATGKAGTETVRWNESVAGQDGFITTAGQFGDDFIVDVILPHNSGIPRARAHACAYWLKPHGLSQFLGACFIRKVHLATLHDERIK